MGSARANVVFVASVVLGLAVFAAVILIGNPGGLTWVRFGIATAAFFAVAPGCAWIAGRTFLT
jgi:hypothetical protein